jgi:hypothetical protein
METASSSPELSVMALIVSMSDLSQEMIYSVKDVAPPPELLALITELQDTKSVVQAVLQASQSIKLTEPCEFH